MTTRLHSVTRPLSIPEAANPRWGATNTQDLRRSEQRGMHGYHRVIGGGEGDLYFNGYDVGDGVTTLVDPAVLPSVRPWTGADAWTEEDLDDLAEAILKEAYAAIGMDCLH